MNPSAIFSLVNGIALIAWLALMVRPRHAWVTRLAGWIVPMVFALVYAVIIALRIGRVEGDFSSLAGVAALFRDPWVLLAGWVHYLAFDLLTGVWETKDAAMRNIPHLRVVPCLILTFLFGPVGWLLYVLVRSIPVAGRNPAG
jgi:hypothetical protein